MLFAPPAAAADEIRIDRTALRIAAPRAGDDRLVAPQGVLVPTQSVRRFPVAVVVRVLAVPNYEKRPYRCPDYHHCQNLSRDSTLSHGCGTGPSFNGTIGTSLGRKPWEPWVLWGLLLNLLKQGKCRYAGTMLRESLRVSHGCSTRSPSGRCRGLHLALHGSRLPPRPRNSQRPAVVQAARSRLAPQVARRPLAFAPLSANVSKAQARIPSISKRGDAAHTGSVTVQRRPARSPRTPSHSSS
jgi:hypothetical protein